MDTRWAAFTGPEQGLTPRQFQVCRSALTANGVTTLCVGDCIGADAQITDLAHELRIATDCHPPSNPAKRAFTTGHWRVHPPRPYLVRNHDMVDDGEFLLAAVTGRRELLRSGYWATIRYARKIRKARVIVYPDGAFTIETGITVPVLA